MNHSVQLIKWLTVPLLIVVAQVALNAKGTFASVAEVWGFIGTSLVVLLIWRHRLGKFTSYLTQRPFPSVENVDRADRRFAALSLSLPFLLLFALKLVILALVVADPAWMQPYVWTLWTIFGITAVGSWQILPFRPDSEGFMISQGKNVAGEERPLIVLMTGKTQR